MLTTVSRELCTRLESLVATMETLTTPAPSLMGFVSTVTGEFHPLKVTVRIPLPALMPPGTG